MRRLAAFVKSITDVEKTAGRPLFQDARQAADVFVPKHWDGISLALDSGTLALVHKEE